MKRMVKNIGLVALAMVALTACEKQAFPEVTPANATFKLTGTVDGEPWEHHVGIDDSYLSTYVEVDEDGHGELLSVLENTACENCAPVASFSLYTGNNLTSEELLSTSTGFDLESVGTEFHTHAEMGDVLEAGHEVFINGEPVFDDIVELSEGEPITLIDYSVAGGLDSGDPFIWNVGSLVWVENCTFHEWVIPGIELSVSDEFITIEFPEEFEYGSVSVLSAYPTANLFGIPYGEPLQIPVIPLMPPEMLSFTFEGVWEPGVPTEATLDVITGEWQPLEIPSAYVHSEWIVEEPVFTCSLEWEGSLYTSFMPCLGEVFPQSPGNFFTIQNVTDYTPNEDGWDTRKVDVMFEVDLYNVVNPDLPPIHLAITEGVLGFAVAD